MKRSDFLIDLAVNVNQGLPICRRLILWHFVKVKFLLPPRDHHPLRKQLLLLSISQTIRVLRELLLVQGEAWNQACELLLLLRSARAIGQALECLWTKLKVVVGEFGDQ